MTILNFAQVFTGARSELGGSNQMVMPRQSKQAFKRQQLPASTLGLVSPSVIGSCSPTHEIEEVDDRLEEEGGSAVLWRSCRGCAFLCAAHEPRCQVCGTQSPFQTEEVGADNSNTNDDTSNKAAENVDLLGLGGLVVEIAENADLLGLAEDTQSKAQMEDASGVASESTDDGSDDESDGEEIEGTLDVAPPAGTHVKVLHDDDKWYLAEVLASRGAKAKVRFESGARTLMVDFGLYAVRLADYTSDDESDSSEDESEWEGDDNIGSEGKQIEEMAKVDVDTRAGQTKDDEDSEDEEEQIPGTLDEAPPVGTTVKVLCDDDRWYPARITASSGTKAMIIDLKNGEESELDFEVHAVRLIDYVGEDEECDADDRIKETQAEHKAEEECRVEQTVQVDQPSEAALDDSEVRNEDVIESVDLLGLADNTQSKAQME